MKFLHAMIRVKDIEKSLDFYTNLLGLKIVKIMELEDCKLYFLQDETGGSQIELTYNFETPYNGYECGNCFGHFAFETQNLDEFTKKLEKLSYTYLYEPFELPSKNEKGEEQTTRIAFIKDPDGNEIEIIQN